MHDHSHLHKLTSIACMHLHLASLALFNPGLISTCLLFIGSRAWGRFVDLEHGQKPLYDDRDRISSHYRSTQRRHSLGHLNEQSPSSYTREYHPNSLWSGEKEDVSPCFQVKQATRSSHSTKETSFVSSHGTRPGSAYLFQKWPNTTKIFTKRYRPWM